MYRPRSTSLNLNNFWVLLGNLPISSAKIGTFSVAEGIGSHQFVSSFHKHTCISSKPVSHFLCKSILFGSCNVTTLPTVFAHRGISTCSNQQLSFTVSYLINSIGLCPKSASTASKRVNFKTSEKPDKVINLLKKYGFTQPQISKFVSKNPKLLLLDAETIILPKLEFFEAKGISGPEIAKMLSVFPNILGSSLAKQIMPAYDFYRNFFSSHEDVIVAVKRFPDILTYNIGKYVVPKFDILRECGVPVSKIASMMKNWPMSLSVTYDQFRKNVEKVENMGFDASNVNYVVAVHVFRIVDESRWQSKVDAYKKWGWSEEEILKAFHKYPWCMVYSTDKIIASMDFFINQMSLSPCFIAKDPSLLSFSLKKRIIPRFSVFQVLLMKGLLKDEVSLTNSFKVTEKKFVQKFITPYMVVAPELLKLYKKKLNLPNVRPVVDQV